MTAWKPLGAWWTRILTAGTPVQEYAAGTWGPQASAEIVNDGDTWHDPVTEKSSPC